MENIISDVIYALIVVPILVAMATLLYIGLAI
jgi:hypothetical protein